MGKRLRAKNAKTSRDKATAYAQTKAPWGHKVAIKRSKKAKKKNAHRMT
jgi:hypothetical protein